MFLNEKGASTVGLAREASEEVDPSEIHAEELAKVMSEEGRWQMERLTAVESANLASVVAATSTLGDKEAETRLGLFGLIVTRATRSFKKV